MRDQKMLWARADLLQAIRRFFVEAGSLEVETPLRLPSLLPEAHIEPEKSGNWLLQTSPEMCMKRLLAAGCGKIFQVCKCDRKNERGSLHVPEFTMLEWYRAGCGYEGIMAECREFLVFLVTDGGLGDWMHVDRLGLLIQTDWEKLTVAAAFRQYAPVSLKEALESDFFEEILCTHIEPQLGRGRPTFLYDYPASLGALARLKKEDKTIAERFELYINGLEIANGFSELADPVEQRSRFEKERQSMLDLGRDPGTMPEKFLADLVRISEAGGIALGVDRLLMILSGASTIDEVLSFTPEEL